MTRASRFLAALDACLPPERLQHGRVERMAETIADATGGIGRPYVAEGLLAMLERRGDISPAQRQAGWEFMRWFTLAALDPLRAADIGQSRSAGLTTSPAFIEHARLRINRALDSLGGISSPAGSCAWFVLGLEMPMSEWARREGWSGKPIRAEVAKGTLLATLGVLVAHFRIGPQNVD